MKLGIVTYQIGHEWDLETLIATCETTGFEGVELRTTHGHGVEVSLSASEREAVRARFADSSVNLVGLGSAFEYHAADQDELRQQIEDTKAYVELARDVGADGVKVRPNRLPEGVAAEQTIAQIGHSLREVGAHASDHGIRIRLEVHGPDTCQPKVIRQIMDIADHPNVFVCWNSNRQDQDESGSIDDNFELLRRNIDLVHINQLHSDYPWARLFALLTQAGYDGYCLAEIPASSDSEMLLRYYRALYSALQPS